MNTELFLGQIGLRESGLRRISPNPGVLGYSTFPLLATQTSLPGEGDHRQVAR